MGYPSHEQQRYLKKGKIGWCCFADRCLARCLTHGLRSTTGVDAAKQAAQDLGYSAVADPDESSIECHCGLQFRFGRVLRVLAI